MGLTINNRFLIFWSILGAVGFILIWNLPWRFQVNDDEVMMWLVSGDYTGKPEWFAVFLHPVLSWIFSLLYKSFSGIPWYAYTWIFIMFSSFVFLIYLIEKQFGRGLFAYAWALFLFGFYIHFLFFMQFSIVAGMAVFAGLAGRLNGEFNSQPKFTFKTSDIFILIGFLVRPEVLFLFLAGLGVFNLLVIRQKHFFRNAIPPLIILVIGLLIGQLWIQSKGLSEFQSHNRLRSQVFDHPVLQLDKEAIKETHPELYYFANGLIDFQRDPGLLDNLKAWKLFLDQKRWEWISLDALWTSFATYVEHENFLIGLMLTFALFSFSINRKKTTLLLFGLLLFLAVLSPFYLLKVQIYALVMLLFMLLSFCFIKLKTVSKGTSAGFALVLTVGITVHFYSFFHSSINRIPAENLKEELDRLKQGGYHEVYLIGGGNLYSNLVFDHSGRFKILGWPTLLEMTRGEVPKEPSAFLVDSVTYSHNMRYFEMKESHNSQTGLILLTPKK